MGMEIVLALLVLVGLLLVYGTLRARLSAFARELHAMKKSIDAPRHEPPPPAPVVDLRPLEERVDDLQRRLDEVAADTRFVREDVVARRGHRLREEIERYFRFAGYQSINVPAEIETFSDQRVRLAVSGSKGGITYKGYVVIEDGRIVEEKMTSSHEVFP